MPGFFVWPSLGFALRETGAARPRVIFSNANSRISAALAMGVSPIGLKRRYRVAFYRPGSDLLSRVLRRSTIGAGAFHGRVRKGNGCSHPAITTRSIKGNECFEKLDLDAAVLHPTKPGASQGQAAVASCDAPRPEDRPAGPLIREDKTFLRFFEPQDAH